jgi:hypothetical protein
MEYFTHITKKQAMTISNPHFLKQKPRDVRFQVLTSSSTKTVFWDVPPRSFTETDRRFGDAYCLHHHRDHPALPDYMVQHHRRQTSSECKTRAINLLPNINQLALLVAHICYVDIRLYACTLTTRAYRSVRIYVPACACMSTNTLLASVSKMIVRMIND